MNHKERDHMTLRVFEPMRDVLTLREAMDRMFEDAVVRQPGGRRRQTLTLPLDIDEQPDKLVVRAPVPGFEPSQIDISVQGDVLSLRGTQSEEHEQSEGGSFLREWRAGSFQRVVQLPAVVESEKAKAGYKHGVLTIELPKVTEQVTRKITVSVE